MRHTATTENTFHLLRQLLLLGFLGTAAAQFQLNNAGTLSNEPQLTKLVELLDRAGITPSVGTTILAPSNEAFGRFKEEDEKLYNKYTTEGEFFVHLETLLLWNFVMDSLTTEQIFDGSRLALENPMGNITVNQQLKKVDNVALTDFVNPDIITSDGIIHIIDKVIVPPFLGMNLVEHMLSRDPNSEFENRFRFTTFANLVLVAGLDEFMDSDFATGITVMVPPNRRFNRAQVDVPSYLLPENKIFAQEFVKAHIVRNSYHEAGIFADHAERGIKQEMMKSELGTSLWFTTTANQLRFQSREVLLSDQAARNGIFHAVDLPLFPPDISDFTELMHISTSWDTSDCFRFFRQALLTSREIAQGLNSSLTMFCPTREAFAAFNNEDFNRLQEPIWVRHGTEFLMNHITYPALTRQELIDMAPGFITMLNGATYELRRSGDRPRIKNTEQEQARSEFGDIVAIDGLLHMVDSAITPTAVSQSVYDQSNSNPDFSLLVENIDFVQLTDLIDRDTPLTFFAPHNPAWERVTFGTLEGGEIIKRHLFGELLFCDKLANFTGQPIPAVNGENLYPELRGPPGSGEWGFNGGQRLYFGGAHVYDCDNFARNGLLHFIDRVIGVPIENSPSPTDSPAPTVTPEPTVFTPPTAAPVQRETLFVPIVLPPVLPTQRPVFPTPTRPPVPTSGAAGTQVTLVAFSLLLAIAVW